MGCTRVVERVCAAAGQLKEASTKFETTLDVPNGGVLWGLPALLANGLLKHAKSYFSLPKGFYGVVHIFILLAYMALTRIKTPEQLRYYPAGEGGKLLGLDRLPEVRTLREKIKRLAAPESVSQWSEKLSKDWMKFDPEAASVLYIDGHIRVYHGSQTKLPRRYVARQRLCLRGTTDYWVNDQQGRPFFVVSTPFTSGLQDMLKREIVPQLLKDVSQQPTQDELDENPCLHRFVMVFDREGYSPDFLAQMWEQRIACQTYHKYPKEDWLQSEFRDYEVTMPDGNKVQMKLAERGVFLGGKLWVREIRKLTETDHQTSIVSTDYISDLTLIAVHMFTRWSQENFFKYMMQHYNIDGLMDYQTILPDETMKVVNPAYRTLESQIRSQAAKLSRKESDFGAIVMNEMPDSKEITEYERIKGELKEEIDRMRKDLVQLKEQRKQTSKHLTFKELPESERFTQLAPARKHFIDTIRMIAYRAETAMTMIVREVLARSDDARSLVREICMTEADLIPNEEEGTLTVRLHHLTNQMSDDAARFLAEQLNASETDYPGTNLRLVYKLVSDDNPPTQEF